MKKFLAQYDYERRKSRSENNIVMIIICENGRLGNQIFQYNALKSIYNNERIVFLGFDDFSRLFKDTGIIAIGAKYIGRKKLRLLTEIMKFLAACRLIGVIEEKRRDQGYKIIKKFGFFFWISLVRSSHFQHNCLTEKVNVNLQISEVEIQKAKTWLQSIDYYNPKKEIVFVHIRRGDYVSYPNRKSPAVLPKKWYVDAISKLRCELENPLFVVLTDDVPYAEEFIENMADIVISPNEPMVDFSIMSLCSHGILSASSFAWWGAWFAKHNSKKGQYSIFLAPNYWIGYRNKTWWPADFKFHWLTYLD